MSKRAVIYARVSTDEQSRGYSLVTQTEACGQYASERGYEIIDSFLEDYTGASLDRPALNAMRAFVAETKIDVVVVYDLDRLARKAVYQMLIEEELGRQGVRVEYVLGQYADTDEGRLHKQIRASIAEYEKAKIIERGKRGKRGKARSGFVVVAARPPYGYVAISEPHKSWLEIDEEEAQIVRQVFQWYVYGDEKGGRLSIRGISQKLTAMGVLSRGDKLAHIAKKHGPGTWTGTMIRNILKNETYIGVWHFGKTEMQGSGLREQKSKTGTGKQVAVPRDRWIAVEVPAIIDESTFAMAQNLLSENKQLSARNSKYEYLMGRRLRCSKCGYTYVGHTRHNRQSYRCNGKKTSGSTLCDMPTFKGADVDETIWKWIRSLIEQPERIQEGLQAVQEDADRLNRSLFERLELVDHQLVETTEQLDRLLDLYLAGDFPKEMLSERKARLEELAEKLRHEQVELSSHLQRVTLTAQQREDIETFCASMRGTLDQATFSTKRQIIDLLDVRAKLACENEEKVIYAKCLFSKQRLSLVVTSPLLNTGASGIIP